MFEVSTRERKQREPSKGFKKMNITIASITTYRRLRNRSGKFFQILGPKMPTFILPKLFKLPNLRRSNNPRSLQLASYQTRKSVGAKPALYLILEALRFPRLPDHTRAAQNRLAHPRRHHRI